MRRHARIVATVLAGVVLAGPMFTTPTAAAAVTPPATAGRLDPHALQESLDGIPAAGAPGVFAEVRDGWRRWRGASGVADLSTGRPTLPWMRQRVGSITKTFVATTLLQLVGEDRLGIDDPVGRWLPELPDPDVRDEVTIRMLLNHTSGIGNYTDALLTSLEDVERIGQTRYTPPQLVEVGLELPRTGEPGEAFSYSNTNYILAGLVIEKVTGRDPAKEIHRRIIRRLGLWGTYFPGDEQVIRGPHAAAYFAPLGERDFSVGYMSWAWMAGEMVSTMADLDTFFRALLGGLLLPPEQLAQMRTTVPMDPDQPEAGGYGLGIYTVPTPCGPVWGHDGGVIGQITVSLHTEDTRNQVSFGMNISHYGQPGELHPIDLAYSDLLLRGLCPEDVASTRSATLLRLPALPHL